MAAFDSKFCAPPAQSVKQTQQRLNTVAILAQVLPVLVFRSQLLLSLFEWRRFLLMVAESCRLSFTARLPALPRLGTKLEKTTRAAGKEC